MVSGKQRLCAVAFPLFIISHIAFTFTLVVWSFVGLWLPEFIGKRYIHIPKLFSCKSGQDDHFELKLCNCHLLNFRLKNNTCLKIDLREVVVLIFLGRILAHRSQSELHSHYHPGRIWPRLHPIRKALFTFYTCNPALFLVILSGKHP